MMMIVYWYLFSNHYTRECIHTCERERTCGSSQSFPGFVLAPSSWCRHASHAHHLPSPPCLVSSQAGFGMQCYSPLQTRTLGPPWSVRGLLMKSYLNLIHVRPSRLLVFVVGACPCCLPRGWHHCCTHGVRELLGISDSIGLIDPIFRGAGGVD